MPTRRKTRKNRVTRFFLRTGVGFVAGVAANMVAFETITTIFFGFGWYSHYRLVPGAIMGAIVGLVFGPIFVLLQTPMWKAIYWEAAILCGAYLVFFLITSVLVWNPYGTLLKGVEALLLGFFVLISSAVLAAALRNAADSPNRKQGKRLHYEAVSRSVIGYVVVFAEAGRATRSAAASAAAAAPRRKGAGLKRVYSQPAARLAGSAQRPTTM
jgi:phosphoglycerol transferase MdoB-like AlkP superfamily enzyme